MSKVTENMKRKIFQDIRIQEKIIGGTNYKQSVLFENMT